MITSVFDHTAALYDAGVHLFASAASHPSETPQAIIFPGGGTPKSLFDRLTTHPPRVGPSLCLGLTDERMVPEEDPASNYRLMAPLIQSLDLPPERVLRVDAALAVHAAADAYNRAWNEFFDRDGGVPLAFLGIGEDGHTCSLFSPEQIRNCPANRLAEAVLRPSPPHRVTITPALLRRVRHVVFLATGRNKEVVVEAMTRDPASVPAGIAVQGCSRVSLWYAPE